MRLLKNSCITLLFVCISLSACNASEVQLDSQFDSENSSVSEPLFEQENISTEESSEEDFSQPDLEALEESRNRYSTILVSCEDGELQVQEVATLKNYADINPDSSHPESPQTWKKHTCKKICGNIILYEYASKGYLGSLQGFYNIQNQETVAIMDSQGFTHLPNGKYAGYVYDIDLNGEDFATFDVATYNEKYGMDLSILQSKTTTHPMTSKSFILFENDGTLSDVQLDIDNDRLRIELDEIMEYYQSLGVPFEEGNREYDPVPVAQGIAYFMQKQQYYVPLSVNHASPLKIAVFNHGGDLVKILTDDDIQASSIRYSTIIYTSYMIDKNTVIFDGSGHGVSSFILDLSAEVVTPIESKEEIRTLMEQSGYYRDNGYKKPLPTPPFTIEAGSSDVKMILRLVDHPAMETALSSDYYLVDWEETETGFQAILGLMPYSERDQFIEREMQYQPWDYRSETYDHPQNGETQDEDTEE